MPTGIVAIMEQFDDGHISRAGEHYASRHWLRVFGPAAPHYLYYIPRRPNRHLVAWPCHHTDALSFLFLARLTSVVSIPPGYVPRTYH